ncbi:MAG: hypothetical protein L0Y35_01100 [Flammeovirgaceae bacterium]|nr:hypothetical protein [Flammeovirgaceae bacterium]
MVRILLQLPQEYVDQFRPWNEMAKQVAYFCWAAAALVVLGHIVKLLLTREAKDRYDYINKSEIKLLWIAAIIFIVGACFYANSNIQELSTLWIFVRVFTTISMGTIAALVVQNLLKFYYPFFVEKRLKALRYQPRISPKTGKPMKLLSEEEEDAYLDEGMQAEENVFSMDYDVWMDPETKFVKIEKYSGHLHALQCPECNYQTFKVVKEEILKTPTASEEGELLKHYQCGYCGYKAKKTVTLKASSSAKFEESATTA